MVLLFLVNLFLSGNFRGTVDNQLQGEAFRTASCSTNSGERCFETQAKSVRFGYLDNLYISSFRIPRKALTLALHGITGTGKNYASSIIADALFEQGMRSRNVHLINGNLHNDDPSFINAFKADLFNWIKGNISTCGDSLFIFDEVDKLPVQVIDVIKPFVDHNTKVEGVDPRRAIFMFLSNSGSERINRHTLEHNQKQKSRESIPIIEIERIVQEAAFNQGDGGFKDSALISHHLIDYFVPFLPLTREHVILCVKEYARQENIKLSQEDIESIASRLVYFPKNDPVFASSGCKQIEEKVNLFRFLSHPEL